MITGIICTNKNWEFQQNGTSFKIEGHERFIKHEIRHAIVILDERNYLELSKQKILKENVIIVYCQNSNLDKYKDCICVSSEDYLIKLATILSKEFDVYIIGDYLMNTIMLPYYDAVFATIIDTEIEKTDYRFIDLNSSNSMFKVISTSKYLEDHGTKYKFFTYVKEIKNNDKIK